MEIIKYLRYTILLLLVVFTSCDKMLDVESINTTSPEGFIKDRQTATNALASAYAISRRAVAKNGSWLAYSDLRTGNLKMNSRTGIYLSNQDLNTSDAAIETMRNWNFFLEAIAESNSLIENIDNASNFLQEDELDSYKGQAYFLRALMHLNMTEVWGDCPVVLSSNVSTVSKSSKSDVLKTVIADALQAIELLPLTHTDNNGNIYRYFTVRYANKIAAISLLIKAYVADGNYADAIKWHQTLAVENRARIFELEIGNNLADIYDGGSNETVFGFSLGGDYGYNNSNLFGWDIFFKGEEKKYIEVTSAQYITDLYNEEDLRLNKLFNVEDESVEILKYSSSFLVIFRLTEIDLLAAEAYFKTGNEEKALAIINKLKVRAGLDEESLEGDALWNEIMQEFERELFAEGKLFFHWDRWGVIADKIETISQEQYDAGIAVWPIADVCFTSNPGLSQNPYWLNN